MPFKYVKYANLQQKTIIIKIRTFKGCVTLGFIMNS